MCGILAVFRAPAAVDLWGIVVAQSAKQRHRGPDWSGAVVILGKGSQQHAIAHERLIIVGLESGTQPLRDAAGLFTLGVNGEIYNHQSLEEVLSEPYPFAEDHSDCEVIIPLYREHGPQGVALLDGQFSLALHDARDDSFLVARDPVGITSLYRGYCTDGSVWYASELKVLVDFCGKIDLFPPGHYYSSITDTLVQYYTPVWLDERYLPTAAPNLQKLRRSLERAVHKRMMAHVPFGVLLSGGLDSSLVAAIAAREYRKQYGAGHLLHSFAIGLSGSPDLQAAERVAQYIGTNHHTFTFSVQDGLDALPDVIRHLETYDVTTVRASTPMFLLSRKIKAWGIKMVLSGEGSDEIFGGYLYFHRAPSAEALHCETISRIKFLHTSDCLRANKSTMAWGLEARVPFLDCDFLEVAMTMSPAAKLHKNAAGATVIEKHVLRSAFAEDTCPYLPAEILWRQKEQFSDGVGYLWVDGLKAHAGKLVSDDMLRSASFRFPLDTPTTKEMYLYRTIFEKHYPQGAASSTVVKWVPKEEWGCASDPSGRAQSVHLAALQA